MLYFNIPFTLRFADGVHDNLDPQQLGISPAEARIEATTWEEAEKVHPALVEAYKNSFRKKWLEDMFTKQLLLKEKDISLPNSPGSAPTTPRAGKMTLDVKTIVDVLLQHCVNILLKQHLMLLFSFINFKYYKNKQRFYGS